MIMPHPPGIRAIAADHPVFFVDQYGVLHDGHRPYPGAAEALGELKAHGRKVVILSNSGRTGGYNAERLAEIGFPRDLYDHFVTSGDVAFAFLAGAGSPVRPGPETRCLTVSGVGDRNLATAMDFSEALHGGEADFVIIAGSRGDVVPLDTYRDLLEPAARRGVPAICTNPDMVMLTRVGPRFGAGRIAALYSELGGPVTYVGKPYPDIYVHAARLTGVTDPAAVVCVGDSVEHDVVGARRFGAAAVLVRTGIHATLDEAELEAEIRRHDARPDLVIPSFRW
jgi:HAD superfamily hydrolase (TIGR01459 family)